MAISERLHRQGDIKKPESKISPELNNTSVQRMDQQAIASLEGKIVPGAEVFGVEAYYSVNEAGQLIYKTKSGGHGVPARSKWER